MKSVLEIKNLTVDVEEKNILNNVSLTLKEGEIHAIMGPNGSGKSTFAMALAGHPKYQISKNSKLFINSKKFNNLPPQMRAKLGLLVTFQQPIAIPGVNVFNFLRLATNRLRPKQSTTAVEFLKLLEKEAKKLDLPLDFLHRFLNDNLSGGEKKKTEVLQTIILNPRFVIFDEIDTGLDIDALKTVARAISEMQKKNIGVIIITHYQRILKYLKPDRVHVLIRGKIIKTGSSTLAQQIEKKGYEKFLN